VVAAAVAVASVMVAAGCGSSKTQNPTTAPTVSLWVSATAKDYRQVAAGAKLALAEAEGHAGPFRVNFAGRQVSDDPAVATKDALNNARTSLKDTQASAVVTALGDDATKPAVFLLNSAGISTVVLGDDAMKTQACDAGSDLYPSGHPTAIVLPEGGGVPSSFRSSFSSRLGFAPDEDAYRAYTGVKAVLASLAASGVATDDSPPRLDRDALAAQLVQAHGGCGTA
jgi:ABC-type branched-subunit amino acid transport system substrate-binding protein